MNDLRTRIRDALQRVCRAGATYADARYYREQDDEGIILVQGNLKSVERAVTTGIGVRVLYRGAWGFAATGAPEAVQGVAEAALENARVAAQRVPYPVRLAPRTPLTGHYESPCAIDPFDVPLEEKVGLLQSVDAQLTRPWVAQRMLFLWATRRRMLFLDSDGAEIEKVIHELFARMVVIGVEPNGMSQERSYELRNRGVGTRGWEAFHDPAYFTGHAPRVVEELGQLLAAEQCPQDTRSVILLPGIMFLQTHEVIGHALELDRILGYELSYAGGSFVRLEDFGTLQYGSEKLTVRADATLPNSPGSFGYDDDGIPCQNYVLIERGILKNAITSRQTIVEANEKAGRTVFEASGGCARACGFNRVPLERMTNINIDPGTDGTLEDIIAHTERGIVLDGARSWSIGSNREQFHFACEIGWLVEDGVKTRVVKNPTYGMETLPFWRALSAVGDERTRELVFVPNCGKGLPSQIMHLGHFVPVCRFDNVPIGR
ncbi:MAG: TldD/PmbA family protein [bacterium]|nr:TldD/PmbA family protein [bacterium]